MESNVAKWKWGEKYEREILGKSRKQSKGRVNDLSGLDSQDKGTCRGKEKGEQREKQYDRESVAGRDHCSFLGEIHRRRCEETKRASGKKEELSGKRFNLK